MEKAICAFLGERLRIDHTNLIFEEGEVYERRDGELVKVADGVYKDPSGAIWRYHSQGPKKKGFWAIRGEDSSSLRGMIYFSTDIRNPDHKIEVEGTLVVEGNLSDSGELYIKQKPDEWALVVGGDLFLRDRTDIWGKVYVGGNLKLTDSECINGCEGDECECGAQILPIAKYHDKGKVYVSKDCLINGRFHINNLDLVQRVYKVILEEDETMEGLQFSETIPIDSPVPGEPSIAIGLSGSGEGIEMENYRRVLIDLLRGWYKTKMCRGGDRPTEMMEFRLDWYSELLDVYMMIEMEPYMGCIGGGGGGTGGVGGGGGCSFTKRANFGLIFIPMLSRFYRREV